jgi:hypothetical protein
MKFLRKTSDFFAVMKNLSPKCADPSTLTDNNSASISVVLISHPLIICAGFVTTSRSNKPSYICPVRSFQPGCNFARLLVDAPGQANQIGFCTVLSPATYGHYGGTSDII